MTGNVQHGVGNTTSSHLKPAIHIILEIKLKWLFFFFKKALMATNINLLVCLFLHFEKGLHLF